jgi:Arc/MetJ-type ribon-helix-helix transcriptional regulator
MAQINFHTTPEFEKALAALMKARGLKSRSEAIRAAVQETAEPLLKRRRNIEAVRGLLAPRPGEPAPLKDSKALLDEIDAEMEAKLERLARR